MLSLLKADSKRANIDDNMQGNTPKCCGFISVIKGLHLIAILNVFYFAGSMSLIHYGIEIIKFESQIEYAMNNKLEFASNYVSDSITGFFVSPSDEEEEQPEVV